MTLLETSQATTKVTRKVLLVEDSPVTQDIVQLVLTQAGHAVSIAADGAAALRLLKKHAFDVVLTDFHLPDITGLDVVQRFLAETPEGPHPTFVAITGDVRSLLADRANCELFDRVVPKPLDIDLVCELVEAPARKVSTAVLAEPQMNQHPVEKLPFTFFHWPGMGHQLVSPNMRGIDAILVHATTDLNDLWRQPGAHLLPIIDLTGQMGARADVDGTSLQLGDIARVTELIDLFHNYRTSIHNDFIRSDDAADRILARIYVSGGALVPRRSGANRSLITWNLLADPDDVGTSISKLVAEGLVDTAFFERVHYCTSCESARLLVREECPNCEAADLTEESYLHHFRCAYQGPEGDFRRGDELTCPKCRRDLCHFGRDYDRPGLMVRCNCCATHTSEPNVAFICVDCAAKSTADAVLTRDVFSAKVSGDGVAYLQSGRSVLGAARQSLRFADLPLELVIALNRAASQFNEARVPFVLGYIAYDHFPNIRNDHGARQASDARRLWLEAFKQAVDDKVMVSAGTTYDFFLIPGVAENGLPAQIDVAKASAAKAIRFDLGIRFQLFGPGDIAG